MGDQLMQYLYQREQDAWLPVPRYRQRPYLIVKFRCGHSETSSTRPLTSGMLRCKTCGKPQPVGAIQQPRFRFWTEPSRGRIW